MQQQNLAQKLALALNSLYSNKDFSIEAEKIIVEVPPKKELGDFACPMFAYSKALRLAPQAIATEVANWFSSNESSINVKTAGPYLNFFLDLSSTAESVVSSVLSLGDKYGNSEINSGKKIMIEFSCPNTNKPLHLGHLRNDSLGESISRILKASGAEVKKVNLINNRGIHICKSMLAYKKFGSDTTPQSENIKSDHFVGNYYVKFDKWSKEDETALPQAQAMLVKWEEGDSDVLSLWEKMNKWTIDGINETYKKTGISFDKVYFESETYKLGKEEVLKGVENKIFYKDEEGTVWIDLEDIGLDKKVLLRKDGTSLYLTQDLGTAISRHKDFPFDSLIYVVASEQQYHFKVLFHVLSLLGYSWAKDLFHLSYGMVNLPDGKMKSREGTVVDADDLFAELSNLAKQEIISKGREGEVGDINKVSDAIALGALNYYLLATTPSKDMIFNPKETISFQGNTGPYTQYMGARISSLIAKYNEQLASDTALKSAIFDAKLLNTQNEREIVKLASDFPKIVQNSAIQKNPALIISFLYDLCKVFSRFYHDTPILNAESANLIKTRVTLCEVVLQLIKNCFALTGIPFLAKM